MAEIDHPAKYFWSWRDSTIPKLACMVGGLASATAASDLKRTPIKKSKAGFPALPFTYLTLNYSSQEAGLITSSRKLQVEAHASIA
jgi:hypothetical protein